MLALVQDYQPLVLLEPLEQLVQLVQLENPCLTFPHRHMMALQCLLKQLTLLHWPR
jgi:hypothetical protein